MKYVSNRGHPLVMTTTTKPPRRRSVITVEMYVKWYTLFVVHPNDRVEALTYGQLEDEMKTGSAFVDHVPNPAAVKLYAVKNNFEIDDLAWEIIVGRWKIEVDDDQ